MLYDKDIREPLFEFLDDLYPKNRIFEEKEMGRSRADVVMRPRANMRKQLPFMKSPGMRMQSLVIMMHCREKP